MSSVTGPSDARFETTAAWQAAETSNTRLQAEVEQNAQKAHDAAAQAASNAQFRTPSTAAAVEQLEQGLSHKTEHAVAEGDADIASAKAAGAGYVQQAREIVGGAMATAASYLPTSIPGTGTTTNGTATNTNGPGVAATLQSAAGTAVNAAQSALASAQQTTGPYVESARSTAQPYVDSAIATVQPHVEKLTGTTGQATSKPAEVAPTTAPLEFGDGAVGGPYNATKTDAKPNGAI